MTKPGTKKKAAPKPKAKAPISKTVPAPKPKAKAAPKPKAKKKIADPRMIELQDRQRSLDAEEKRIKAVIKAEQKAIADAEKKVTVAGKGLNTNLAAIKKAIGVHNASLAKAKTIAQVDKADAVLLNSVAAMQSAISTVSALKGAALTLINGEPSDDLDDL